MRPIFLLGVGAQKAGTTWLHRYLSGAPEFAPGAMKEYHVWDELYRVDAEGSPPLEGIGTEEREALRGTLIANPELYFDHFAELLDQPEKRVTADITPSYSALHAGALERIKAGFESRAIDFKVIFVMRDPVERCWSAARMYRRKRLAVAGLDPALSEADFVRGYAATPHARSRGGYEQTVAAIEAAVAAGSILFRFYEQLFEPECVRELSQFAGVEPVETLTDREFNVSPKTGQLSVETRRFVAESYRDTLDFCGQRFPRSRSLWPSYSLL